MKVKEILNKYTNMPSTVDTIQKMKCELVENGYDISYIDVLADKDSFLLESSQNGDCVTHFVCKNGMWEKRETHLI